MEKHKFKPYHKDGSMCAVCFAYLTNPIHNIHNVSESESNVPNDSEAGGNVNGVSETPQPRSCISFAEKRRINNFSGKVNKLDADGKCEVFEPRPKVSFWIQKSTVRQLSGWDLVITADEQQVKVLLSFGEFEELQAVGVPVREGGENVKV